jgi:hypothetical protein
MWIPVIKKRSPLVDDSDSSVHLTSNRALDVNGDGMISDLDGSPTSVSSCSKNNGNYLSVLDVIAQKFGIFIKGSQAKEISLFRNANKKAEDLGNANRLYFPNSF